jgi:serine phosphatase RsbU (regulator of sigma subunit)
MASNLPERSGLAERTGLHVLLIEDDPGDAMLVRESLRESDLSAELTWIQSIDELGEVLPRRPRCVLLDLGLPGFAELEALQAVLEAADEVPVLVLTGLRDRDRGLAAVGLGAEDYLVKDEVDGAALARSIRYAVERRRAQRVEQQLLRSRLLRRENVRLERGLLPRPLLRDERIGWAGRYQPGADSSVLGGDFYDTVEQADGTLRLVIGDVSGHGPDEAALGVSLRIAWRTMVLNGTPGDDVLPAMALVFEAEGAGERFATVCDVTISADRRRLAYRLAGHPPPVLVDGSTEGPGSACALDGTHRGLPLGVVPGTTWPRSTAALPDRWALLAFTDGLVEPRVDGHELGTDGLLDLIDGRARPAGTDRGLEDLLDRVMEPHRATAHPDDVAVIGLSFDPDARPGADRGDGALG